MSKIYEITDPDVKESDFPSCSLEDGFYKIFAYPEESSPNRILIGNDGSFIEKEWPKINVKGVDLDEYDDLVNSSCLFPFVYVGTQLLIELVREKMTVEEYDAVSTTAENRNFLMAILNADDNDGEVVEEKTEIEHMPSPPLVESVRINPVQPQQQSEALLESLRNGASYKDYFMSVVQDFTPDQVLLFKEVMKVFKNSQAVSLFALMQNRHGFMDVMLNDYSDISPYFPDIDTAYATKFRVKTHSQATSLMGKVPQSTQKREAYVLISPATITGDAVYLNPYARLQYIPVVENTSTIDHALANERVHAIIKNQVAEVKGLEVASAIEKPSPLLDSLTDVVVNSLSDIQITTYNDDPQFFAVRFASQGAQTTNIAPELLPRRKIKNLVYKLSFGLPPYYKILNSLVMDSAFNKDLSQKLSTAVLPRLQRLKNPNIFDEIVAKHRALQSMVSQEGPYPQIKGTGAIVSLAKLADNVNGLSVAYSKVLPVMITDRSSFTRFYKLYSAYLNEGFYQRVLNDQFAVGAKLYLYESMEYVRQGVLAEDKSFRMRPPFYPGDEAPISKVALSEFPKTSETFVTFLLDYTNKNVISHFISGYDRDSDMITRRKGQKEDKRAEMFLEHSSFANSDQQIDHVKMRLLEVVELAKMNGHGDWFAGLIVPFDRIHVFARHNVAFVTLAPYPSVSSFYVVFTSKKSKMDFTFVASLIDLRRLTLFAMADSFMHGTKNLAKMVNERMENRGYVRTTYWFEKIFAPQYKLLVANEYSPFVDTSKSVKKGEILKTATDLLTTNWVMNMTEGEFKDQDAYLDRYLGEYEGLSLFKNTN